MIGTMVRGEINMAIRSLRRNRGRSYLTMLGIVIAVTSVITAVSIGEGVRQQVVDQTDHVGRDLITIRPGQVVDNSQEGLGQFTSLQIVGSLSTRDVSLAAHTTGVKEVLPLGLIAGGIHVGSGNKHFDVPVIATDASLPTMLKQTLHYGSFFDPDSSANNKVVLGAHMPGLLFNQNVPLGQTVTILGQQFIVTGILDESQAAPFASDFDFNNVVFISSDAARLLTNDTTRLYEIFARPTSSDQLDTTVGNLQAAYIKAHGGQHDVMVLKQSQTLATADRITQLLTALTICIAAIALLVGGVGIMNVMLVSVTERMHEVGLRKAVGAMNHQILRQFVVEAAVLSIGGAFVGVVVSFLINITIRLVTDLEPLITWEIVALSCLVSIIVGILFGSAPAIKAARKDPISALRNL